MNKYIILLISFTFVLFISISSNISADTSQIVSKSTTTYSQIRKIDDKIISEKVTEKKAKEIKDFKKYIKEMEKNIKKEKSTPKYTIGDNSTNVDSLVTEPIPVSSMSLAILDNGGGGGTNYSLIITGHTSTTTINCTEATYTYCKAYAESVVGITKLVTSVSMNPNSIHGAHIKSVLTWDGSPMYSVKDFMSVSWDQGYVSSDIQSIKAYTKVWFDYSNLGSSVKTSSYQMLNLDYDTHKDVIDKSPAGIIWTIDDVYRSYAYNPTGTVDYPFLYVPGTNDFYEQVTVNRVEYTLETDLDLMGTYTSYNSLNKLSFQSDYRHVYPSLNLQFDGMTLRGYFDSTKGLVGFLGVKLTITTKADESRLNDIDFIFHT